MEKLTKQVKMSFTESQYELIESMAEQSGESPSVWARDLVIRNLDDGPLDDVGPKVLEVLTEVKAVGRLVGELAVELMLHVHDGDQEKAFIKTREMFQRSRADKPNGGA